MSINEFYFKACTFHLLIIRLLASGNIISKSVVLTANSNQLFCNKAQPHTSRVPAKVLQNLKFLR